MIEKVIVLISNPKTNIGKLVNITDWTIGDLGKLEVYANAGYDVTFKRYTEVHNGNAKNN